MYTEEIKNISREKIIKNAIKALTKNRSKSTLIPKSYVRDIHKELTSRTGYDKQVANYLEKAEIKKWESFYSSLLPPKKASELKIAYLCGPNPLNDLEIFIKYGVLPENVWAFESEKEYFDEAVLNTLLSSYPRLKLHNINFSKFITHTDLKFDIVYLDFCGPLISPSKDNNQLETIKLLFEFHRLNSPGVIATNLSLVTKEQNSKTRNLLEKLTANYLYPKGFLERGYQDADYDNFTSGTSEDGLLPDEFLTKVREDFENYYGQFITRLIMDLGNQIVPNQKIISDPTYIKDFFNFNEKNLMNEVKSFTTFDEDGNPGDIHWDSYMNAISWFLASTSKLLNDSEDKNYPDWIYTDKDYSKLVNKLHNAISITTIKNQNYKTSIELIKLHLLRSSIDKTSEYISDKLANLFNSMTTRDFYNFCDIFYHPQATDLLINQLSIPYHLNVKESKRWRYKAKETEMFLDLLIFDECRYLYDYMPTVHTFPHNIHDINQQLAYRFVLDGVSKHSSRYSSEFFYGTAVVDFYTKGFKVKYLKPRKVL